MTADELLSKAEKTLRISVETFRNCVELMCGAGSVQSTFEPAGDSMSNAETGLSPTRRLAFLKTLRRQTIRSIETQMDWAECVLVGPLEDKSMSKADGETARAELRELKNRYTAMCAETEIPGEMG
jgi:hypothetical protein